MTLRRFCVAPMMDCTDRHARFLHRLLSRHAYLYTEMVTTGAVLRGERDRLLGYSPEEHPVAVQLGGSDPAELAEAARICEGYGYAEVNLNVGCPSDRVQSGRFGACLMAEPALVAQCVEAMTGAVTIPVTVKCRLGIDDQELDRTLPHFITTVRDAGCQVFIVHARKAWLQGLSPKENRTVPPLDYERVYRLSQDFPDLEIIVNGGITSLADCAPHLERVHGVMLGRAAYQDPYLLAGVDSHIHGAATSPPSREEVLEAFMAYVESQLAGGTPLYAMIRHALGLYQGVRGARTFRRTISELGPRPGAGVDVLARALTRVQTAA